MDPHDLPAMPPADESAKILDRGRAVILYRNGLGGYTAAVVPDAALDRIIRGLPAGGRVISDGITPSIALRNLAERATTDTTP